MHPHWTGALRPVLLGWISARLLLVIARFTAKLLVGHVNAPRGEWTLAHGLFIWDAMYYSDLASTWYQQSRPDAARFFPFYPAIGNVGGRLFNVPTDVVLLVVNNCAAFVGAIIIWRLALEVTGQTKVADRAAWMIAILPSAFVLSLAYTEGLAILFTGLVLLLLHRRSFAMAAAPAFLVSILRPVGGVILVAILVELYLARRTVKPWKALFVSAAPLVGFIAGMWWVSRSFGGDLTLPYRSQSEVRGGFMDPVSRSLRPLLWFVQGNFKDSFNFLFIWGEIALFWLAVRFRQPLSWILFTAVSMLVLFSSEVVESVGRYGLVLIPLVIALAQWAERRWQQVLVGVFGSAGFIALASLAWIGRLTP